MNIKPNKSQGKSAIDISLLSNKVQNIIRGCTKWFFCEIRRDYGQQF